MSAAPLLWSLPVTAIFAREFIEAFVIVGNYRTLVTTQEGWDEERKKQGLRTISIAFAIAFAIAFLMILITAIVLGALQSQVDPDAVELIEGVSKIVAAFSIAMLSLKVPKWLGIYNTTSTKMEEARTSFNTLTVSELRFNVAWNIWREMAEVGEPTSPSSAVASLCCPLTPPPSPTAQASSSSPPSSRRRAPPSRSPPSRVSPSPSSSAGSSTLPTRASRTSARLRPLWRPSSASWPAASSRAAATSSKRCSARRP
jgi:hypothetical protein